MSDLFPTPDAGPTPRAALRALPLHAPPRSAWAGIAAQLPASKKRSRRPLWLAAAAAVLLAVAIPNWRGADVAQAPDVAVVAPAVTAPTTLDALLRESAQLEAWIAWTGSSSGDAGATAAMEFDVRDRIVAIDALLSRPELDPAAQLPLLQERLVRLRELAGLHHTRQLLAANGAAGDAAPVMVF